MYNKYYLVKYIHMNYTEPIKTRSIPLLPQLKKRIAYRKLKRGKPVSRFTKGTKKEVKNKLHLVSEAKRLMEQTTPCADDAVSQNLSFEALEEIQYDSDEYSEDNACEDDACEDDACEDDACEDDACEDDACEDDACEDDACEDDARKDDTCEDDTCEYDTCEDDDCKDDACKDDARKDDARKDDTCEDDTCEDDACEYDTCEDDEIDDCKMQNIEKSSSPIHMHLLDNELEYNGNSVCADDESDTSDTEYKDVLDYKDEKNIFQMDEEIDIVDSDFQLIS